MKNVKIKLILLILSLSFVFSIKPSFALNDYKVNPGAYFRWDATKYFFLKDGLGIGNNLEYTLNYYLEFNFTNWAGVSGAEYLNGTVNNNGTVFTGEITHEYYYGGQSIGQEWVTDILDYQGTYPVHVYLVCNTEIEQTTRPNLQNLAAASWLTLSENPTYNFSLTGVFIENDVSTYYTGYIKFNSDMVLSYVFDELIFENNTISQILEIERYTWTLTYIPGNPTGEPGGPSIPGFQIWTIACMISLGVFIISMRLRAIQKKH